MVRAGRSLRRRLRRFFKTVNLTVFGISTALVVAFAAFGTLFRELATDVFERLYELITVYFGWYYLLTVTFLLVFAIWLMLGRHGRIRLGRQDELPEFGFLSWFAMLFSAGMGIGLIFWSIAEPITYFQEPPRGVPGTVAAAETAMLFTFFHWGLHAWAVYTVLALTLSYFAHRHRMPFTIRSIFYPMLGDRIYGPIGHVIDILAVFATLFGLATSLGLGVMQLNTGLHLLFGLPFSVMSQVLLIAGITLIAVISVVSGLNRGLKWLSLFNIALVTLFMVFLFVAGPTLFLLRFFFDTTGRYLQQLVELSLWNDALGGAEFQQQWTIFYWAWWIAWSPFVSIFIARVSRGRTIRQFVAGTLLLPTLFVFVWLTLFGGTALYLELGLELESDGAGGGIAAAVAEDPTLALYLTLEQLPWATLSSIIASILIVTYFITSSDSATHVVDALLTRGSKRSPTRQRVIWGVTEGLIAAVLLVAGGAAALEALQTASLATGLPFSVILLLICLNLHKALEREAPVPRT